jgi:hypothetical protein
MSLLEASALAIDFLAEPATLRRFTAGAWQPNGVYLEGTPATSTIQIVIQPPGTNDLQMVDLMQEPEGERNEGIVLIWTRTDLQTANSVTGLPGDEIEARGRRYNVITIMERAEAGFTKALARVLTTDRDRTV